MQSLGVTVHVPGSFEEGLARTREALKAEGFGVLTEIDLQAAFREKLGQQFRRYVIFGACNPALAHRAVSAEPEVGLLLPCNVTIEEGTSGETIVRLVDPIGLLGLGAPGQHGVLSEVAAEASARLERVGKALIGVRPARP
jgi:uncharacterized protein (DUF302 family)